MKDQEEVVGVDKQGEETTYHEKQSPFKYSVWRVRMWTHSLHVNNSFSAAKTFPRAEIGALLSNLSIVFF